MKSAVCTNATVNLARVPASRDCLGKQRYPKSRDRTPPRPPHPTLTTEQTVEQVYLLQSHQEQFPDPSYNTLKRSATSTQESCSCRDSKDAHGRVREPAVDRDIGYSSPIPLVQNYPVGQSMCWSRCLDDIVSSWTTATSSTTSTRLLAR